MKLSGKELLEYMRSIKVLPPYPRWSEDQLTSTIELCKERVGTLSELKTMVDTIYHEPQFTSGRLHNQELQPILTNFDANLAYCTAQLQESSFTKEIVTRTIK